MGLNFQLAAVPAQTESRVPAAGASGSRSPAGAFPSTSAESSWGLLLSFFGQRTALTEGQACRAPLWQDTRKVSLVYVLFSGLVPTVAPSAERGPQ